MKTMIKIGGTSLAALLFIGSVEASNTLGADNGTTNPQGILLKEEVTSGSYCHMRFPSITDGTLPGDHPVLGQTDMIDFYGPCKEDPLGEDQVHDQRLRSSDRQSH
jgi:hypothetical protein